MVVTGSARLDVFGRGGDSLAGRYFPYRLHPLTLGELLFPEGAALPRSGPIDKPNDATVDALWRFGGFPEPFLRADATFWRRWQRTRTQQLVREDLRDLASGVDVGRIEVLADLIRRRAGQLVTRSALARELRVSEDTARRWVRLLQDIFWCFEVRPWSRNVARSLRKQPKLYLRDHSGVPEDGPRAENYVATHLRKAVDTWTDLGPGDFGLWFVRDKDGREVDFLVTRDDVPWFLVEVKVGPERRVPGAVHRFKQQTGAAHAFVVAGFPDREPLPWARRDPFAEHHPIVVPVHGLLARLP